MVADDMCSQKVFVDEETQELKLKEFRAEGVEPAYLDILRWRMDQKYGRRIPKKKAANGIGPGPRRGSPYGSPTEERGRSPNRFPSRGPGLGIPSPRVGAAMPSPLSAQVQQDPIANPVAIRGDRNVPRALETKVETAAKPEKLVEAPTPTSATIQKPEKLVSVTPTTAELPKEGAAETDLQGLATAEDGGMKNVAI
jgi:hypothetical protein